MGKQKDHDALSEEARSENLHGRPKKKVQLLDWLRSLPPGGKLSLVEKEGHRDDENRD